MPASRAKRKAALITPAPQPSIEDDEREYLRQMELQRRAPPLTFDPRQPGQLMAAMRRGELDPHFRVGHDASHGLHLGYTSRGPHDPMQAELADPHIIRAPHT